MTELEEYIRIGEPSQRQKAEHWQVAIGLQQVDGLQVSDYLRTTAVEHIEGRLTQQEVEQRISAYYTTEDGRREAEGTDEADQVSARIVSLLSKPAFTFSPAFFATIHRQLFSGILPYAGIYRDFDISKKEWVLNGATVMYGMASAIADTLKYDFGEEKKYVYRGKTIDAVIAHFASFIAGIWQIHPFREGNTRTTAVFAILYLRHLGYDVNNGPFKDHSWYFRNALVRANYNNLQAGIAETTDYLVLFFRNILLGESNPLKNRYLHVDWRDEGKYVEKHVEEHVEEKTKTSERIVAAMKADPYVTGEMLQQLLGLSRRGIEDSIARLRKRGRISREGNDNGGRWIVKEED